MMIGGSMQKAVLAGTIFAMACTPVLASDRSMAIGVINAWYGALAPNGNVDEMQQTIDALLDPEASIVLTDIDTTQTAGEFLDSLDVWADAISGGFIAHRILDGATGESVTAIVCYHFENSELMTEERFTLSGFMITGSVQNQLADNCGEF